MPIPTKRTRSIALTVAGVIGLLTLPLSPQLLRVTGYHATPRPDGMLARFELPPSPHPFGRPEVRALELDGFAIEVDGIGHDPFVFSFPEGDRIDGPDVAERGRPLDGGLFDFDGDGIEDRIEAEGAGSRWSTLRVLSGADGRTLFLDVDPAAYTPRDRGRPLPDLDGDGRSELALYHPRDDRSTYDPEIVDAILDVKSWVTVVAYDGH